MNAAQVPKILQVIPALRAGGAEQSAIDVSKAVATEGWTALIASAGGRRVAELPAMGVEHVTLPLDTKNPLRILANAIRLRRLIRARGIDLVHARSRAPAWSAWLACRWSDVPFITTYHGAYGQKNRIKALYNSVMARGIVTIANSSWTARLVRQRHGGKAGRIVTIHRGIDLARFDPETIAGTAVRNQRAKWGAKEGDFIVLHLARLTRLKGQITVVEAFARLKESHPHMRVILAGEATAGGDYLARLKAMIARHGLEDRVVMPGYCDRPALAIAAADVVLSASHEPETFGRVAVEAGALERPVIVADIGATAETVLCPPAVEPRSRTGWAVPPADADALAAALAEVAALDTRKRQGLGQQARRHVAEHFTLDAMGRANIDVYRDILERP